MVTGSFFRSSGTVVQFRGSGTILDMRIAYSITKATYTFTIQGC